MKTRVWSKCSNSALLCLVNCVSLLLQIYFIDDMNMPFVDKYDTQSAIEIVRQYVDYGGWYDKVKIMLKDIVNCQLMGCMNPTAGSFQITPRMQRHFVTFGVMMPGPEIVRSIYSQMIDGHLSDFEPEVARLSSKLTDATIELHKHVMNNFLPSAVKFHYQFNLRDLSNISQVRVVFIRKTFANQCLLLFAASLKNGFCKLSTRGTS